MAPDLKTLDFSPFSEFSVGTGARVARREYLAFIDDDCVPTCGWLSALTKELRARPDSLLGGYVENGLSNNPYSTASQHIARYARRYYEMEDANEWFFGINNFALSAKRFRELGGFDTSIPSRTAEDKEFCDRWRARDYQMAFVPDALVYHFHDLSWWQFVRQHFNYGRGLLFFRLKRHGGAGRSIPERFGFYWRIIFCPAGLSGEAHPFQQIALITIAQAATAAGALRTALVERPPRSNITASPSSGKPWGRDGPDEFAADLAGDSDLSAPLLGAPRRQKCPCTDIEQY